MVKRFPRCFHAHHGCHKTSDEVRFNPGAATLPRTVWSDKVSPALLRHLAPRSAMQTLVELHLQPQFTLFPLPSHLEVRLSPSAASPRVCHETGQSSLVERDIWQNGMCRLVLVSEQLAWLPDRAGSQQSVGAPHHLEPPLTRSGSAPPFRCGVTCEQRNPSASSVGLGCHIAC